MGSTPAMRLRCAIMVTLAAAPVWADAADERAACPLPAAVHLRLSPAQADGAAGAGASVERDLADALADHGCVLPGIATAAMLVSDNSAQRRMGELAACPSRTPRRRPTCSRPPSAARVRTGPRSPMASRVVTRA